MSKYESLLNSIEVKKVEDLIENKIELTDIVNMHPMLDLDNPLTYMIFLENRKDLSTEDRNCIYRIMARLHKNKQLIFDHAISNMKVASEPDTLCERQTSEPETVSEIINSLHFD